MGLRVMEGEIRSGVKLQGGGGPRFARSFLNICSLRGKQPIRLFFLISTTSRDVLGGQTFYDNKLARGWIIIILLLLMRACQCFFHKKIHGSDCRSGPRIYKKVLFINLRMPIPDMDSPNFKNPIDLIIWPYLYCPDCPYF